MSIEEEAFECDCGHPLTDKDLNDAGDTYVCPNCSKEWEDGEEDIDYSEVTEGYEQDVKELDEEEGFDYEEEVEDEEEDDEEIDEEEDDEEVDEEEDDEEVEDDEESEDIDEDEEDDDRDALSAPVASESVEEEDKVEKEKLKIRRPRKFNHAENDYLEFFLGNPDGVTISMLRDFFDLDLQGAHYAQRRTFAQAKKLGYECTRKIGQEGNTKIFLIQEVV